MACFSANGANITMQGCTNFLKIKKTVEAPSSTDNDTSENTSEMLTESEN